MKAETIAAIATSVGEASIGIIRISGPASVKIARAVFRNFNGEQVSEFIDRKLMYGRIVDPVSEAVIDEALVVYMEAPHSYTCEDVIELQTHGGTAVLRKILRIVLNSGARLASPGEFTQRAFLNGRIDLSQAEAVMDIIRAKTDASVKMAAGQLSGALSEKINSLRKLLLDMLAEVEAAMDYPEEDIPAVDPVRIIQRIKLACQTLCEILATAKVGKVFRDGLCTVIVGRPNVGKSSLLNVLLGEERALVTEVPGTTRDSIEEFLNLRGIPLKIVDTAGLRETGDRIEQMGMQRARDFLASAGLVLFLIDASEPLTSDDFLILSSLPDVPVIVVVNKTDLPYGLDIEALSEKFAQYSLVTISAKERKGFVELEDAVEKIVYFGEAHLSEATCVDNIRHEESLILGRDHLDAAIAALQEGLSLDCMVIDVRLAVEALGQITGESVSDEVVKEIFAKFCLGK